MVAERERKIPNTRKANKMKKITSIEELQATIAETLENAEHSVYMGLRGATKHDLDLMASGENILDVSCDDWDDRDDCEYTEDKLDGSSAIKIADYMLDEYYEDDQMLKSYNAAKYYADNYNETEVVLLVSGESLNFGDDDNEVILSHSGYGDGANVIAIVDIAI